MFLRCGDYLKFLMGLRKTSTKICAQIHVFSLWRLTWVFDGTWKNFHKKVCPVTRFFAVETILSFWGDLESFGKKMWPVTRFFFAAETILSVWVDLESFDKKLWPATHFFRSADYLKFLMGLRKISTKICAQIHVFSLWKLTWVFDGTWKNFHKKVCPVICFFAVETISSFWWGLEKFRQKICAQIHVFSLWRLTWVFDGTWKNFHKKVCPVTRFFAVETILSFWWDLESFGKKMWPVTRFFRCGDYLKCLSGLGKFRQKVVTSYTFFSQCRLSQVFDGA